MEQLEKSGGKKGPVHRKKVLANIDYSYLYEEYLAGRTYEACRIDSKIIGREVFG